MGSEMITSTFSGISTYKIKIIINSIFTETYCLMKKCEKKCEVWEKKCDVKLPQ